MQRWHFFRSTLFSSSEIPTKNRLWWKTAPNRTEVYENHHELLRRIILFAHSTNICLGHFIRDGLLWMNDEFLLVCLTLTGFANFCIIFIMFIFTARTCCFLTIHIYSRICYFLVEMIVLGTLFYNNELIFDRKFLNDNQFTLDCMSYENILKSGFVYFCVVTPPMIGCI